MGGFTRYRAAIEALKAIRIDRAISQRELARRLGKPPSFINKIELLERRLDVLEFVAIAKAMQIDPVNLMNAVLAALPDSIEL